MIAAALVAGASSVLADVRTPLVPCFCAHRALNVRLQDSADPSTGAVYANQDNAATVHSTKNAAWKEIRHFVGGYNFFELLNYPGARDHRHAHSHVQSNTPSGTDSSTPTSASADLATGSGDAQLQPQEREFEDMEELQERKNHKKKHGGKKHKNKKKKHGGKKWWKKKKHNSHKKKHNNKKHNNKKHGHKHDKKRHEHHHKREEENAMDLVVRAYYAGDIDARMFDELVERYNVVRFFPSQHMY